MSLLQPHGVASGIRVSQEEFDDVVQENIETFEMPEELAVKDALTQFKERDIVEVAVTAEMRKDKRIIQDMCSSLDVFEAGIRKVSDLVEGGSEFHHRTLVRNGAVDILMKLAVSVNDSSEYFRILGLLFEKSDFARDVVPREGFQAFMEFLQSRANSPLDPSIRIEIFSCLRSLKESLKSNELNKRALNELSYGNLLVSLLASSDHDAELRTIVLRSITSFMSRDDDRQGGLQQDDFGRGRRLVEETTIIETLTPLCETDPLVVKALLLVCVNDFACQKAVQNGIVDSLKNVVLAGSTDTDIFSLLRRLSLNDEIKRKLGLDLQFSANILRILNSALDTDDVAVYSAALGCLEMIVLRQPQCGQAVVGLGGLSTLVRCLLEIKQPQALTFALRALRNIVSSPLNFELKANARVAGAEKACRDIANAFPQLKQAVDDCLRDMNA